MKLNIDEIASLRQKRLNFDFDETLEIPELAGPKKNVSGSITVSINAGGVKMTGELEALLELSCDVCLGSFTLPLEIDIDEQFVYSRSGDTHESEETQTYTKEKELNPEDFYEVLPDDKTLDVTDIVYQAVVLSLPAFAHCGEACRGIPLKTRNQDEPEKSAKIDPRWESLKTLFQNKEN